MQHSSVSKVSRTSSQLCINHSSRPVVENQPTRHGASSRQEPNGRPSRTSKPNPIASSSKDPVPSSSRNKVTVNQTVHEQNGKLPEREVHIRVDMDGDDEPVVEERLLDDVPLEIQEAWICEELMFAFQVSITSTGELEDGG